MRQITILISVQTLLKENTKLRTYLFLSRDLILCYYHILVANNRLIFEQRNPPLTLGIPFFNIFFLYFCEIINKFALLSNIFNHYFIPNINSNHGGSMLTYINWIYIINWSVRSSSMGGWNGVKGNVILACCEFIFINIKI